LKPFEGFTGIQRRYRSSPG